ncbi:MAG: hypothetical protein E7316_08655 [Clostridiales bacterium]|nr:hypothetical protein [Clostridiales bacterium]
MYPDTHRYDDMLALAHPVSPRHRPMNRPDRAAQFSPFAALVGLDAAIDHTARNKAEEVEFSQYTDELLEWNLQILQMQYDDSNA